MFEVHSVLHAACGVADGEGVGVAQIHEVSVVQLGLRQAPLEQLIVTGQSESVIQAVPHIGTGVGVGVIVGVGLGVGVGVAVAQIQSASPVQLGFRQRPLKQVIPVPQLVPPVVHVLPQAGTGVGVGVGEETTVNSIVHEVKCACGCDSGAVGAIGACVEVRLVMTTTPIAPSTTMSPAILAMIILFLSIFTMLPKVYNFVPHMNGTELCRWLPG